jgi:hypothetical protein
MPTDFIYNLRAVFMGIQQLVMAVDVSLEFLDPQGNGANVEQSVTDLIMRNGARVLSSREIPIGEFLVLKTADGLFESPAVVKSVQVGEDRIPRIVLEFTGLEWQRKWIFPEQPETPEIYYDTLVQQAKEMSMYLNIIISELEDGQSLDQVFLSELKISVDELRDMIFRIQKAFRQKE